MMQETLIRILAPYVGDVVETVVEEVAEAIESERMRADGRTYRDGFEAGRADAMADVRDILDDLHVAWIRIQADAYEDSDPKTARYLRNLADIADIVNE